MKDCHLAMFVLVLAIAYLVSTFQLPSLEVGDPLGPKVFPILLGIALVASAFLLIREGRGQTSTAYFKDDKIHLVLIGSVIGVTLLYILLFENLGFLLINSLFLFLLLSYFHRKHWVTNTLVSILFTVVIYSLFAKFLGVTLAKGILYF